MHNRWKRTFEISKSVWSKCRPYNLGASPSTGSMRTQTSWPLRASCTALWLDSIEAMRPMTTFSREGTQMGVPSRTTPASTCTPTTMGARLLKTISGRMRSLQGKTAWSACFRRFSFSRASLKQWFKNMNIARFLLIVYQLSPKEQFTRGYMFSHKTNGLCFCSKNWTRSLSYGN